MKKIYTCYACGFPFRGDDENIPQFCPSCGSDSSYFLSEPDNEDFNARRIHVDPPKPDPNRDPYNLEYHCPKEFPEGTEDGRIRRFVMSYKDAEVSRKFYEDIFGWDIVDVPDSKWMYCVTGPSKPNWEPRVAANGFGFLIPEEEFVAGARYMIQVDDMEKTIKLIVKNGGRVLKDPFELSGYMYAAFEDSEGNPMYLWETPKTNA